MQIFLTLFLCLYEAQREKHTLLRKAAKRNAVMGISPPAGGDQRSTALNPCRLLEKTGENFNPNSLILRSLSDPFAERGIIGEEHHADGFFSCGKHHAVGLHAAQGCGLEVCNHNQLPSDQILGLIPLCDA